MSDETNKPGQNDNAPKDASHSATGADAPHVATTADAPQDGPAGATQKSSAHVPTGDDPGDASEAGTDEPGSSPDEATSGGEPLLDLTEVLHAQIDVLERQQTDLANRLAEAQKDIHRYQAEIQNLHRRREREAEEAGKYAITKFARDVVGVSDNFERAISSVPADAVDENAVLKSLLDGVTMTEREFLNVLERHGVQRISPQDEPFDPHKHQAVMEQEDRSVPAGTVLQVYQAGYMIADRILRPAMVVVARGGPKPVRKPVAEETDADAKPAEPEVAASETDAASEPRTAPGAGERTSDQAAGEKRDGTAG